VLSASLSIAAPYGGPLVVRQKRLPVFDAAERALVLHRPLAIRLGVVALAALLVAGGVQTRHQIYSAGAAIAEAASTGLASAGFGISAIDIAGQALTAETTILDTLAIGPKTSLLAFDAEAARNRILALPAVADASIAKAYPDRLVISVTEKQPIARWTVDGKTWLVDAAGTRLAAAPAGRDADLPLVIGEGAADDAAPIIRALSLYPALADGAIALSRIGDRRWDLLYDTGLRVQLPETGITYALRRLGALEQDHAILARDLSLIDLRVPDRVLVRVNQQEDAAPSN